VRSLLVGALASLAVAVWMGCGGSDSAVEQSRSNKAEVAIRNYLGEEFLYEDWYRQLGEIDVAGRRATVATALGPGRRNRGAAQELCEGVLASGVVTRASVGFGNGRAVACP
jgi:hypothetical protein